MPVGWAKPQVIVALLFAVLGLGALWIAANYPMGTLTRMEAGFFPVIICVILIGLSVSAAIQDRRAEAEPADIRIWPFICIMGGIAIWALLIEWAGFFAATFALTVCAAAAETENTILRGLVLAACLSLGGYGLFVLGLGIPLTPFGR
ncbi:tripartite tricarboxylate transporter TctB family protein [Hoeflea alexandrii]|uniref:tripartite tricarboxylate transporter TctB family protein n=1 Tax=Hoeflea alexandrii TaxID=288436 RepID=UPI0035CF20C5